MRILLQCDEQGTNRPARDPYDVNRPVLMLVVVVAVRDRHVAIAIAMNVGRIHLMLAGGLAFVVVTVVPSMEVAVV